MEFGEPIQPVGGDAAPNGAGVYAALPERVERSMAFLTRGATAVLSDVVGDALFTEDHHNMVMVRDIELYPLCEHHLLTLFGKAHVAYMNSCRWHMG